MVEPSELLEEDTGGSVRGLNPYTNSHTAMPRLHIPLFDGSKPRWWIRRCEGFFQLCNVREVQRVTMAAAYLNDVANSWYQGWIKAEEMEARWNEFAKELCERFGERNMSGVIEEFKMLKQVGTVTEYLEKLKN